MYKTHAQERAESRYNKELTLNDIKGLQKQIQNGNHVIVGHTKDDEDKIFAYIEYHHIPYKVLYTKQEGKIKIITMYPFDVDEYNKAVENRKIKNCIKYLREHGYIVYKNWRVDG